MTRARTHIRLAPALGSLLAAGALAASAGAVVKNGSAGSETIRGTTGSDRLSGQAGNDYLVGGRGNDRLAGGSGRDRLSGGAGKDRLWGGPGKDRLNCGRGRDIAFKSPADSVSRNCERVRGILLTGELASDLKSALQAEGIPNVTVACPPEVISEKGNRFSCTVTNLANGEQLKVVFRQVDRAGNFALVSV